MQENKDQPLKEETIEKKPDEKGGFLFSTALKITDMTENKIVLQQRGN